MNVLNVVSYNIWFDDTLCIERTSALINKFNKIKPDVICLQEVKPQIYEILINTLSDYRYHFPKKINKGYGCVTLSKYPITKCLDYEYPSSKMGRSLLITKINYPYHNTSNDGISVETIGIVIANTHFESLFKQNELNVEKLKQFNISRKILDDLYNTYKNVILCSDTNVMLNEEEKFAEEFENNTWLDSWKLKGSNINKYTYDSDNNMYLNIKFKGKYKSRIDRILFKTSDCTLEEFNIIKGDNECIEPSDHFGIYGKFQTNKN